MGRPPTSSHGRLPRCDLVQVRQIYAHGGQQALQARRGSRGTSRSRRGHVLSSPGNRPASILQVAAGADFTARAWRSAQERWGPLSMPDFWSGRTPKLRSAPTLAGEAFTRPVPGGPATKQTRSSPIRPGSISGCGCAFSERTSALFLRLHRALPAAPPVLEVEPLVSWRGDCLLDDPQHGAATRRGGRVSQQAQNQLQFARAGP
jgi:hypothetical protein